MQQGTESIKHNNSKKKSNVNSKHRFPENALEDGSEEFGSALANTSSRNGHKNRKFLLFIILERPFLFFGWISKSSNV